MGLITSLIAVILCIIFYIRIYKRDLPTPLEKWKVAFPVILGIFSPFLSTIVVLGIGLLLNSLGTSIDKLIPNIVLGSLASSFLKAGCTEEIVKFLIFFITLKVTKPKNVYEYGMLCAGVGVGFTGLEEVLYGGSNVSIALMRLPAFGMHVIMGIIMGVCYGIAQYKKLNNQEGVGKYKALAFIIPITIHTLFDAVTTSNKALTSTNDTVVMTGVIVAIVIIVLTVIFQFYVFSWFKKNSTKYCEMHVE